jgi:MFS family permease
VARTGLTLTGVFAVYVLVLLVTLLFFGSVSDYHLGRLPVIITALIFSAVGCVVFLAAHGVGHCMRPGPCRASRPAWAMGRSAPG